MHFPQCRHVPSLLTLPFWHLFLLFLCANFGTFAVADGTPQFLKLCVYSEQNANANRQNVRKTDVKLAFLNLADRRAIHTPPSQIVQNLQIKMGENLEIPIQNAEHIGHIELAFECHAEPLPDEKVATSSNDHNLGDDQSQNEQHNRSSSLIRTLRVRIYEPDFARLYHINLGSVEPRGMYWHRRLFVEVDDNDNHGGTSKDSTGKNYHGGTGQDSAGNNYHALLYAIVRENQTLAQQQQQNGNGGDQQQHQNNENENNPDKRSLLGYAPLIRVKESQKKEATGGTSTASSKETFNEYDLLIPVDLTHLFGHKIERLELNIFRYDKGNGKIIVPKIVHKNLQKNGKQKKNKNEEEIDDECSICFNPLTVEEAEIMQLHGKEHIFHYECAKKWFQKSEKVCCPLCNAEPELVLDLNFQPIFYASETVYANLYMDPLKALYRIAKHGEDGGGHHKIGDAGSPFQREQAQHSTNHLSTMVKLLDKTLKERLSALRFDTTDIKFYSIDETQGKFVVNKQMDYIVYDIEHPDGRDFLVDDEMAALALIRTASKMPSLEATNAIENMQIVGEKKKPEQHAAAEEASWIVHFKKLFTKK